MNSEYTHAVSVHDEQVGPLFSLLDSIGVLRSLDKHLAKIDHASRDGKEHPLVIVAENPLETVSYPINEQTGADLRGINEWMLDNCNMAGHIVVPPKRVEVTSGFGGVNGNLIWFNTGGCALLLNVEAGEDFKSIILKPGFGFCLGKRERYTRVYLSSLDCADDLFSDAKLMSQRPHAMFFGCDRGDHESWRCFLNSKTPAQEYKKLILPDKTEKREMKIDERFRRLGIELRNNRRAHIRIAPMKGSDMPKSFLSQNINAVEK